MLALHSTHFIPGQPVYLNERSSTRKHPLLLADEPPAPVLNVAVLTAILSEQPGWDDGAAVIVQLLYDAVTPAPPLRDDPRLFGDWELVGTTSVEFVQRKGLTGLGGMPLTEPIAVFFTFLPNGEIIAKEVLTFFGQPILLNELRGKFGFNEDGN
eukprot:CAMPEP_0119339216 /NCGR_PEP_ID=MMETSP1333-20130426/97832_1 /TAXON_ID=418940 /ORGANISM="Scyphosphaera apsteinii, Strain RCC1455" /LENGTH=154 /DNA_ID=CAMNT_0007350707 /DNA_START=68 /DNA_END=529 /DNA_ORIENTATION=+